MFYFFEYYIHIIWNWAIFAYKAFKEIICFINVYKVTK